MRAVRLHFSEGVRDVGVRRPEVPAECPGVDLAETDELPVVVRERARHLPEGVSVVAGEHLSDLVAAFAQGLGDEVAPHYLVEVAEVRDARRRDATLDDNRRVRVAGPGCQLSLDSALYLVCDLVGPERVARLGLPAVFRFPRRLVRSLARRLPCRVVVAHRCVQ